MKPVLKILAVAVPLLSLSACDRQASQPDAAAMEAASGAYKTCAACHGAEGQGNPALQAPALVNLDDWYLERQIVNFREGIRGRHAKDSWGMQMADQATLLKGDDAVAAVVRQITAFDDVVPAATLKGNADRGRDYYNMTCGACHGADALGNRAFEAPSLRGIDDWYLLRQYENFRNGVRGSHADDIYGRQMKHMGQVLKSEQDARDVAVWLLSLGIE